MHNKRANDLSLLQCNASSRSLAALPRDLILTTELWTEFIQQQEKENKAGNQIATSSDRSRYLAETDYKRVCFYSI